MGERVETSHYTYYKGIIAIITEDCDQMYMCTSWEIGRVFVHTHTDTNGIYMYTYTCMYMYIYMYLYIAIKH